MRKIIHILMFSLLIPLVGEAQSERRIRKDFREYVGTLAGEEMAGRAAETRGDTLAMEYLHDYLDGLKGVNLLFDNGVQAFAQPHWFTKICSFNVVGFIEGNDPVLKNEVIVIGAHYDHMGLEPDGYGEEAKYKYGADDNASGTAMVMAVAERLSKERRKLNRSVMIVFFGAEERGLIGSKYLTGHMPEEVPIERVVCMVNFDMVGRLTPERGLNLFGLGSGVELDDYLRRYAEPFAGYLPIHCNPMVFGASDHASFYEKGVPAIMLMTGLHPDYHKSTDTADKINDLGMSQIYRFALQVIKGLTVDALPVTYQKADS